MTCPLTCLNRLAPQCVIHRPRIDRREPGREIVGADIDEDTGP